MAGAAEADVKRVCLDVTSTPRFLMLNPPLLPFRDEKKEGKTVLGIANDSYYGGKVVVDGDEVTFDGFSPGIMLSFFASVLMGRPSCSHSDALLRHIRRAIAIFDLQACKENEYTSSELEVNTDDIPEYKEAAEEAGVCPHPILAPQLQFY